ncbi:GNAT family N-acetyltransferase [Nocardia nepalensis]|uniref:GNAT family N-acetyltransferase n=1 Tax=Nocardia nepalensis TaxID=3375448 RepID=UPI003B66E2C5
MIRRARGRAEMLKFRRWHELAGNTGARAAAAHLADLHDAGLLSAALNGGPLPSEDSAIVRGGVAAMAAARTMALVAVADGRLIGGLIAGPPIPLALQLAEHGQHAVVHAVLNTIMIRAIAVVPQHRGYGIGRALLREAVADRTPRPRTHHLRTVQHRHRRPRRVLSTLRNDSDRTRGGPSLQRLPPGTGAARPTGGPRLVPPTPDDSRSDARILSPRAVTNWLCRALSNLARSPARQWANTCRLWRCRRCER